MGFRRGFGMAPPEPHLDVEAPTALKLQKLLTGPRFQLRFRKVAFGAPFLVSDPIRPMVSSAVTPNQKLVTHCNQGN